MVWDYLLWVQGDYLVQCIMLLLMIGWCLGVGGLEMYILCYVGVVEDCFVCLDLDECCVVMWLYDGYFFVIDGKVVGFQCLWDIYLCWCVVFYLWVLVCQFGCFGGCNMFDDFWCGDYFCLWEGFYQWFKIKIEIWIVRGDYNL